MTTDVATVTDAATATDAKSRKPSAQAKPGSKAKPVLSVAVQPEDYAEPETQMYWIGVTSDCPVHEVRAGEVTFPRFSRRLSAMSHSAQSMIEYPGGVVSLPDGAVESTLRTLAKLGIEVVRREDGSVLRAHVTRLTRGAEPAAKYCWMVPVGELPGPGAVPPQTLLEADRGTH